VLIIVDAAPNGSIKARPCAAIGPATALYLQPVTRKGPAAWQKGL
jgi:hypothetical protein